MNNAAWLTYLDTLPPDHKALAQKFMARVQAVINSDRNKAFDEIQRAERRSDGNAARINDLNLRLDRYEQQRADDVRKELEMFAQDQLPPDERDRLIGVLYNLSVRVEEIERQMNDDADAAQ
jgi:hypothetical protein